MGLLGRLFGREEVQESVSEFSCESVRIPLSELIEALGDLADAMDSADSPLANPGWRGRLRDLREARGSLRLLARDPGFSRDDLFEVLTTVRPLYRGDPPQGYEHLAPLNSTVAARIEAVHQAAR